VRLAWWLAGRLLRKRGTSLLRSSAAAALVAVGLGVAALVVVLALMTGYSNALAKGLLSMAGHVAVVLPSGLAEPERAERLAALKALPGVKEMGEVAYLPALLLGQDRQMGTMVTIRAVSSKVSPRGGSERVPAGPLPIVIGAGLARRLGARVGDAAVMQIVTSGSPRSLTVRISEVIRSGFVEIDEQVVSADLDVLTRRTVGLSARGIELSLVDPARASRLAEQVRTVLGPEAHVTTWQEANRNLFAALRWQKLSLAVVLSLVVGVGAFEVASALVVLVTEKRRELGVLLALGSQPALLRRVLLLAGGAIGSLGVLAGVVFGIAISMVMSALGVPRFSPEIASVYLVERIPLEVLASDVVLVVVASVAEVVLVALLPARRVARWEPVEVLRWV
jgi:lipoprotein-releasing system permease protein